MLRLRYLSQTFTCSWTELPPYVEVDYDAIPTKGTASRVKVSEVMTRRVLYAIGPDASIAEAAKKMKEVKRSCLLVMNDARPIGIISETDLVQKVLAMNRSPGKLRVSQVMSKELRTIGPDDSVSSAAKAMAGKKVRRLVVTEGDNAVGIVTTTDLAKLLVG